MALQLPRLETVAKEIKTDLQSFSVGEVTDSDCVAVVEAVYAAINRCTGHVVVVQQEEKKNG